MITPAKECPFCGEKIKATAQKCRYCGELLDNYKSAQISQDSIGGDQTGQDKVGGDKIGVGNIEDSDGIAVGEDIQQARTRDVNGTFIQADGDVITADVGAGARNTATGKNIIQIFIENLNIPKNVQIVFLCIAIIVVFLIIINYYQVFTITSKIMDVLGLVSPPSTMQGPFNVAIAAFTVVDSNGKITLDQMTDIDDIGIEIPNYLYREFVKTNDNINSLIEIWPPTRTGQITSVVDDERRKEIELLSERVNADIVVYGMITQTLDDLVIKPEFYIRYPSFEDGQEIAGQHELGNSFPIPMSKKSEYWASKPLNIRLQILIRATEGLAYFHFEDYKVALDSYRRIFEEVYKKSEFDCLYGGEGENVVHLLMANANLMLASQKAPDNYLQAAAKHYDCAINLNPTYARAAIGQAIVLTKQALGNWTEESIPENINVDLLNAAELRLNSVLSFTLQPEFADIRAKAHFNLGQLYFYQFLSDENVFRESLLKQAEQEYQQVIDQFKNNKRIKRLTAHSYSNLGLIAHLRDEPKIAIGYLENAVKIADDYDANKGRYYFQLGDYYLETNQDALAVSAYKMCAEITGPKRYSNPDRFKICCQAADELETKLSIETISNENICKNLIE